MKNLETYKFKDALGLDDIKVGEIMVIELNNNLVPVVVVDVKSNEPHFWNTYKLVVIEKSENYHKSGLYIDYIPVWRRIVFNEDTVKICKDILKDFKKRYNDFKKEEFYKEVEKNLKDETYRHSKVTMDSDVYGALLEDYGIKFDVKHNIDVEQLHYTKKMWKIDRKVVGLRRKK